MGISATGHRRTLSSASSGSSNLNPGFRLENDELTAINHFNNLDINNAGHNRMRVYENIPFVPSPQQQPVCSILPPPYAPPTIKSPHVPERPATLAFEYGSSRLRSSLKKYGTPSRTGGGSGAGTPTNPTPPDSLTSDDSSYLSARDNSLSSQSRVRFSPETLLDVNAAQSQCFDPTVPLLGRRMSRRHYSSDMSS